jgi:BioD-like phosphotransacetylase family protein
MHKVIITSLGKIGKTIISLGLGLNLKNVGYIKPRFNRNPSDDARIVKEILELPEDIEVISPPVWELEKVISKFSKYKDYLIIEADLIEGYANKASALHISKQFGIELILIEQDYNRVKFLKEATNIKIRKIILNKIESIVKYPDEEIIGNIPFTNRLNSLLIEQVIEELNAVVLAGHKGTNMLINKLLVGAMTPEHAMKYFKLPGKKTIITGGDREDLILAALSTPTACVILTGDICPSKAVLLEAEKKNVPLLLVSYDTLTTVDKLERLIAKISKKDKQRVNLIKRLIKENVDISKMFN